MRSKQHVLSNDEDNDVGLIFVIPKTLEEHDCDKDMKEAFETATKNEFDPEWKTEESCLLLSPSKRNVFVFQTFEGSAFEHLQQFKCVSLTGPRCLTHCINHNEPMPLVAHPCFTAAMKGLYITASGGGLEVKREIKKKIELMSGIFLKNFTDLTTHVVVSSVASTKYEKALELGIPVRTHEWVEAVWKRSCKEYILATDPVFDKYRCPPFLNLKVCSTGFSVREQERLKTAVAKYGGQYCPALTQTGVDVLVVKHAKGDKYHHAKSWGIACVELRWIYDSIENGNALKTKDYEITGGTTASSPKFSNATLNFSANLSTVQFDSRTHVDESLMNSTTSSVASFCPAPRTNTPVKMRPPEHPAPKRTPVKCRTPVKSIVKPDATPGELKHLLCELDLSHTKRAGSFLDGCRVFIEGWNAEEEEILRKVLKCSGATRFTDLNDQVSHILVGNLEKPFLRVLKNLSHKPHVVNIKWLLESVTQKSPASEELYTCMPCENVNTSEAPSPLSKKGMALLQRETFSPQKTPTIQKLPSKVMEASPSKGKKLLLAKYTGNDCLESNVSKPLSTSTLCMPPPPAPSVKRGALPQSNVSVGDESDIAGSQDLIFTGLNFVIVGLEESTTYVEQELIKKYGGSVVPKSFKGVPDYAVVPLAGATLKQTATDIVTILWLESCIEEGTILPISYFHQPVVMDLNKKPLNGCVLGLSGYSGKERQFICELAGALGAVCQDVFAKKSKSNAKASSHLICKSSEGSEKFKAAIKWFRPAVYHSWLLACASAGSLVSEQDHLVDPKQEIKPLDHSTSMNVTVTSNSSTLVSKVESATVSALRKLPCFKTPERPPACYDKAEVERMLAWAPSPNPYEVKTPPVPLGISENPTPGESKRMQKWLDRLDSKLPVPSPTPPRRVSTPLHELRKKVLQANGMTTPEMNQFINNEIENMGTAVPVSAVALKNQMKNESVKCDNGDEKAAPAACSTPTSAITQGTSRKLFDCEIIEPLESCLRVDSHLDKLNKLMATPEVETSPVSTKTSNVSFVNEKCSKNQVFYDTLKDGSQPYAIKWEDPVNVKRTLKDLIPTKRNNEDSLPVVKEEEQSSKRKSAENSGDEEPPAKRKSSESAEKTAQSPKDCAPKVKQYKFSFSHIDEKDGLVELIHKLGGTVLDSTSYNPDATHLLIGKAPVRSEKLLAFIAAGKWVLDANYLLESGAKGRFVEEEDFEFGNPKAKLGNKFEAKSVEETLSKAVYMWRTKIAEEGKVGAFQGFKCRMLTPPEKAVAFTRLIRAGGGQVLEENSLDRPDFCLVNTTTHRNRIAEYAKLGIPCLPFQFLFEHLTTNPPPEPESRAFDEYNQLRAKYLK